MHFGPWELLAFSTVYIGAIMLAVDVGLRMSQTTRERFPGLDRFTESGWWGFTPLVLLTIGGAIFLASGLDLLPARQAGLPIPGAGQFIAPIVLLLLVLAIWIAKRPRRHRASTAPGDLANITKRLDEIDAKLESVSRSAAPDLADIDRQLGHAGKIMELAAERLAAVEATTAQTKAGLLAHQALTLKTTEVLQESIDQLRGQFESVRTHTQTNIDMLVTSLRARDAEAKLEAADETAMSLAPKLMQGAYADEEAWTADYTIWKEAISEIDRIASMWQGERHAPYLDIRLRDMESGGPLPPAESSIKSSEGVVRYRTVWKVQQGYGNHRDGMMRYFHFKAGELPG
jgi:hypothetical protein